MKQQWNLDSLYQGFNAPQFIADSAAILRLSRELRRCVGLPDPARLQETIWTWLEKLEAFEGLYQKLFSYTSFRFSADTSDGEASRNLSRFQEIDNTTVEARAAFRALLCQAEARRLVENGVFGEYTYYLQDLIRQQLHALPPKEEELFAALELTGSKAWASFHAKAASVQGAEREIAQISAAALNSIKGEVLTSCRFRGNTSPLREALDRYHFDPRILENQLAAVERYLPALRQYFQIKAQALNCPNGLPYDARETLITGTGGDLPFETAKDLILDAFQAFSPEMGRFGRDFFAKGWIDWSDSPFKETGASCDAVWLNQESRLRLRYQNSVASANSLAHELGHGYHFQQLFGQKILNCRYDLPATETASKFSEQLFQWQLRTALPERDRLFCEEFSLSALINTIVDIFARFHFEQDLFAARQNGELSVEELDALMTQAQRRSYGDVLDPQQQNVRSWAVKPHYYSAKRSFYNFPYQFGALMSVYMAEMWKENPAAFVPAYDRFLASTGKYSVLDLCKILGADLLDPAFFDTILQHLVLRLERFQKQIQACEGLHQG